MYDDVMCAATGRAKSEEPRTNNKEEKKIGLFQQKKYAGRPPENIFTCMRHIPPENTAKLQLKLQSLPATKIASLQHQHYNTSNLKSETCLL